MHQQRLDNAAVSMDLSNISREISVQLCVLDKSMENATLPNLCGCRFSFQTRRSTPDSIANQDQQNKHSVVVSPCLE